MSVSQSGMLGRLKAVLPTRWFPDTTPVLDSLLSGVASGWGWVQDLYTFAQQQTRIASASDVWLDMIAQDFFGSIFGRRANEADNDYRSRISKELFRPRGTRGAIVRVLTDLTGRAPAVFEPARSSDTGGYRVGGVGYGVGGGWGSLALPYQCFVTALRPAGSGIASVAGWGGSVGGYGGGALEYGNLSMVQGQVTDGDIFSAVAAVLPAATIGWTRITD